ncbi:DinB family protein [Tsukamurella soli]
MPFHPTAAPTERAGLRAYLAQQLAGVRNVSFGLTEEQIRLAPTRSTLTIGGLLKHVMNCTEGWIERIEAAPAAPAPKSIDDAEITYLDDFVVSDADTLESILARFDAVTARALGAIDTVDLEVAVPVPDAPWFPKDVSSWTARWVILHLVEEVARHAGHADITRENIDGATMYELTAAAEGLGDQPFLKAWRPPARA